MAFLLLYDTELFRHKYLCFQYLSCLDFTACMRFVRWSCFWVGDTWTLVCKCYLNLCSIILRGMCVRTVDASRLLSGSPASPLPRGRPTRSCPETRRPWICPDSVLVTEDVKERGFLHPEDGAVWRACFPPLSLFF